MQGYHRHGQYGIKLQVPLITVKEINGPIEMVSYDYNVTSIKGECDTIKGIAPIGTAILYQQTVLHRGTQNDAMDIRPVIDVSFLNLDEHIIYRIFMHNLLKKQKMIWLNYRRCLWNIVINLIIVQRQGKPI